MSEHGRDDEADYAWLLARERGEPAPLISEARARQYEQLSKLLASLPAVPAGVAHRNGWERDVLATLDESPAAANSIAPGRTPETAASEPPRPTEVPAARRRRWRTTTATAAVAVMMASIAFVVLRPRDRGNGMVSPPPQKPGTSQPPREVTRGMHLERGRLGIDHSVQVRRSNTAVHQELRDGDTVATGDGLRVSLTTSADAHLYLAFCTGEHLQTYPSHGDVLTRAGERMLVPAGGGELVLDDQPGSEVLYLIVSRNEISIADPRLAALITEGADPSRSVDCASLDGKLVADPDRIAIIRYRFIHVAPAPPTR